MKRTVVPAPAVALLLALAAGCVPLEQVGGEGEPCGVGGTCLPGNECSPAGVCVKAGALPDDTGAGDRGPPADDGVSADDGPIDAGWDVSDASDGSNLSDLSDEGPLDGGLDAAEAGPGDVFDAGDDVSLPDFETDAAGDDAGPGDTGPDVCVPVCDGAPCGAADGCGGTCFGTCQPGFDCNASTHVCEPSPSDGGTDIGCADECAAGASECVDGSHERVCANAGVCLVWSTPLACPADSVCKGTGCTHCGLPAEPCCIGNSCASAWDQCISETCVACPSVCAGRCGGPDGCGGQCPDTCSLPQTCGGGGVQNECGCAPDCTGRCGGSDGCGGQCPDNCVPPETCGGGGAQDVCGCTPACAGKCGGAADGCGGICQGCPSGEFCSGQTCEVRPCAPGCPAAETVDVPAGTFQMGCNTGVDAECEADEVPYHTVTLSAFRIDKTESTAAAYGACQAIGQCVVPNNGGNCTFGVAGKENHPINCVDWSQAAQFCEWMGKRLPTEAEWEKAARGTTGFKFPWGNSPAVSCSKAVMNDATAGGGGCGANETLPVGSRAGGAGPFGTLDMVGNVAEWVGDFYGAAYYGSSPAGDPTGPVSGTMRVVRGGGWKDSSTILLRSSDRQAVQPTTRDQNLGFRCAEQGQ